MGVSWAGENRHIAVIGSGVAGLSAAWLLNKRYRVTLFERDRRLGGHSNTLDVATPDGVVNFRPDIYNHDGAAETASAQ